MASCEQRNDFLGSIDTVGVFFLLGKEKLVPMELKQTLEDGN